MDCLLRLKPHARLAVLLALSLCIHLAVLLALSWSSIGARRAAPANDARLTVTLADKPPAAAERPDELVRDDAETEDAGAASATDAGRPGSKFALSPEGLSLPVDQHYFSLAELDERPFAIRDIPPDPPELRGFPQGGKVVMRLWIDEDGRVVNAEPVSSGLPQAFVDSARSGFLNARFAPGRIHGEAVDTVMDVVLDYAPAF